MKACHITSVYPSALDRIEIPEQEEQEEPVFREERSGCRERERERERERGRERGREKEGQKAR